MGREQASIRILLVRDHPRERELDRRQH